MQDPNDLPEPPELDLRLSEMQLGTLSGDLRDAMLTRFRATRKTWPQMSEIEQRDTGNAFDQAARDMVRHAVRLLTSWDWPRVVVRLGDVSIKGGNTPRIEAKLVAANIAENRDVLAEGVGEEVLLLMVDSETFLGARAPVAVDPDEPPLPIPEPEADASELGQSVSPTDEPCPECGAAPGELHAKDCPILVAAMAEAANSGAAAWVQGALAGLAYDTEKQIPPERAEELAVEIFESAQRQGVTLDPELVRRHVFAAFNLADPEGQDLPADGTLSPEIEGDGSSEALPPIAEDLDAEAESFEAHAAETFEASEEELAAQKTRDKIRAEREGGTTEPKPRRKRGPKASEATPEPVAEGPEPGITLDPSPDPAPDGQTFEAELEAEA